MTGACAKDSGKESVGEIGEEARNPVSRWMGAKWQHQDLGWWKSGHYSLSRTQYLKSRGISKIKAVIYLRCKQNLFILKMWGGGVLWLYFCKASLAGLGPEVDLSYLQEASWVYSSLCRNNILKVWQDLRSFRKHSLVYPTQLFCFDIWGTLPALGVSISY